MFADDLTADRQTEAAAIGLESHIRFKWFFQYGLRVSGTTVTDLHLQPFFIGLGDQPCPNIHHCLFAIGNGLAGIGNQVVQQLADLPTVCR